MQTGYRCEISALLEGSWVSKGYHDRVKGFAVRGCEFVWDKPLLTEKPREYKMAQQELCMVVQFPFYFLEQSFTRTEVAVQYLWGSLDTCRGWEQGAHFLQRLYKWAPCLWSFQFLIQVSKQRATGSSHHAEIRDVWQSLKALSIQTQSSWCPKNHSMCASLIVFPLKSTCSHAITSRHE